jgi:hypothetical protein
MGTSRQQHNAVHGSVSCRCFAVRLVPPDAFPDLPTYETSCSGLSVMRAWRGLVAGFPICSHGRIQPRLLAETAGSESAAVPACITSGRALRTMLGDVAARSDIPASEVSLRFGLHWGATLYMGSILTAGRGADALEPATGHATYTPLAELATATDKARRDAPSIAVCEIYLRGRCALVLFRRRGESRGERRSSRVPSLDVAHARSRACARRAAHHRVRHL